jgi:superfamily II RNA helicase
MATEYKFPLDPFQKHAIAAISRDENVLVTAKTGSGKTLVGEYQIAHSLAKGGRVFYTTPIKSLSNQKFHDLKEIYPGRVGILTGDIKFQPDASIVVMTTEILRNLLYKKGSSTENVGLTAGMSLDGLDAVVFDEVHYINNKERGKVWEETLILLPREINLVLLSATIAQPEAFASWLGDLKQKPIHLISTTYRIVPLTHYIIDSDGALRPVMDEKERFIDTTYRQWLHARDRLVDEHADHKKRVAGRDVGQVIGAQQGKVKLKTFTYQLNSCVKMLYEKELLPALFFVFSRALCERYAAQVEGSLVDTSDAAAIENIFDFHLSRYKEQLTSSQQYHMIRSLLVRGIAFHHSGLQPILKEIIEILFGKGLVKVMFCTETFAVGINMPTKTVVFLDYKKYCDQVQGRRMLQTDEYIQMAGRAGRRGKDKLGTVIYLPRDERDVASVDDVRKMMTGGSALISSRMDFGYDFLMKAFQGDGEGRWKDILHKSYWYKQQLESRVLVEKEFAELTTKKAALSLTEDDEKGLADYFAKKQLMAMAAKDLRARLQREIGAWENSHMGPRWKKIVAEYPALKVKIAACSEELAAYGEGYEERLIAPYVKFLEEMGFMADGVLTEKGTCATEINEAHPILIPEAYFRGWFADLSPADFVGLLSLFSSDGSDAENSPPLASLRVSAELRDTLNKMKDLTEDCYAKESACGIAFSNYWDLSTYWVEIGLAWVGGSGTNVAQICSEFGVYEGNLYKFVMSLNNMLDELTSLATLRSDVAMLEKLAEVKNIVMPPGAMAWGESLYLRL